MQTTQTRPSLDEIAENFYKNRPSLDEIAAKYYSQQASADPRGNGRHSNEVEELYGELAQNNVGQQQSLTAMPDSPVSQKPASPPPAPAMDITSRQGSNWGLGAGTRPENPNERTIGKILMGGVSDFANRVADTLHIGVEDIKHKTFEDDLELNFMQQLGKKITEAHGQNYTTETDPYFQRLAKTGPERMDMFKNIADWADPGEYEMPATGFGQYMHDVVRSSPYTIQSLIMNAPLSLLGTPLLGAMVSASVEAKMEQGAAYQELRKMGMSHEEAKEKSKSSNWKNFLLLLVSNAIQNKITFGEGQPGVKGFLKRMGVNALMEGAEEGAQGVIENTTVGREHDLKDLAYQTAVGAGSCLLFGLGGSGINALVNRKNAKTQADAAGQSNVAAEAAPAGVPQSQPPAGQFEPVADTSQPQAQGQRNVRLGSIKEVVKAYNTSPYVRKHGQNFYTDWSPVTPDEAIRIKEATGIDVEGYQHVIQANAIQHTLNVMEKMEHP